MKVIAGLGNPGRRYERTSHNIGFAVLDRLADRFSARFRRSLRFRAHTARAVLGGEDLVLVKPLTYMNLSGSAVAHVMRYRQVGADDLIVVLDDADMDVGRLRVRRRGSSGGHRGLQSIVDALGTSEFARVRVGVGRGPSGDALVEHVLRPLSAADWAALGDASERAAEAVVCAVESGVDDAMNRFNTKR